MRWGPHSYRGGRHKLSGLHRGGGEAGDELHTLHSRVWRRTQSLRGGGEKGDEGSTRSPPDRLYVPSFPATQAPTHNQHCRMHTHTGGIPAVNH